MVTLRSLLANRLILLLSLVACHNGQGEAPLAEPADARVDDSPLAPRIDAAVSDSQSADSAVAKGLDAATSERPYDADLTASGDAAVSPPLFLRLPDPVVTLPHGEAQRARLCANERDDAIYAAFCSVPAPRVTSLAELFALLRIDPKDYDGSPGGFAITGHSTGLSKRSVSAINPRGIFVHLESGSVPVLAAAFTRGETMVEFVARDRTSRELQFYAVAFTLPCSHTERGCSPGELLTSAIERDWQSVDVFHEEDLKNSAIDCRVCHQPAGPSTSKLLRMQELDLPWTHWFDEQTRGGRALLADYQAAHGNETFMGIPGSLITRAQGGLAAAFVRISGSEVQPNEFKSKEIEIEVEHSAPGQPANNDVRGESAAWRSIYEAALRAEAIPAPYHDVKITDPRKLIAMQQAYTRYRAGELAAAALPDIRDVLPDDATTLSEMGFMVDERLDDRALLTAACGLCHNQRLDQSLSRARFHLDLERLSKEEKQLAIDRLKLPGDDILAMPPRRIHDLSEAARERLIALLQR